MDISILDLILLNTCAYLFGIATGLTICCQYKDKIMKSRSMDNLKREIDQANTLHNQAQWSSPVIASAPPPHNPQTTCKLTIE